MNGKKSIGRIGITNLADLYITIIPLPISSAHAVCLVKASGHIVWRQTIVEVMAIFYP